MMVRDFQILQVFEVRKLSLLVLEWVNTNCIVGKGRVSAQTNCLQGKGAMFDQRIEERHRASKSEVIYSGLFLGGRWSWMGRFLICVHKESRMLYEPESDALLRLHKSAFSLQQL